MLHESDRSWTVLASVSGAIYIESDAGEILWIAANSAALHQRAILLPVMPTELPAVGTRCSVEDGCLRVGDVLAIQLRDATIWSWDPDPQAGACTPELARRLAVAVERVALRATPQGVLARVVLFDHATARGSREAMGEEMAAVARRAVASLCRMSAGCHLPEGLRGATGLVGLGEGLTPSGDDLLGAFLFTLRVLDSAPQGRIGIDWQHVSAWLRRVKPLTNKISFAILADHARGDAAAPLCALLSAAVDGSSTERLVQLASRVAKIGHSSGWDMLAGVHIASFVVAQMLLHAPEVGASRRVATGTHEEVSTQPVLRKEVVRVC